MSIQIEQVSKSYGGRSAIADVSVAIDDGEFFVLLGPSGSGKSTLLRAIAGLTTVDRGRIVLHGRDVTSLNPRLREVGFVFQNYALFRHMTVGENIEFALRARRVPAAARRRRREELLRLVALEGLAARLPAQLSGGQQQRVAVARALAHEPRVLLLDEPFGALDARIREDLRRAIRSIQRKIGITTILVTHDQEEAFSMADRIGVMSHARLLEVGEPRALYRSPATRFVATFLGSANLLLGRARGDGIMLGQVRLQRSPRTAWLQDGDEATVVLRPEDCEVATDASRLSNAPLAAGEVTELQFVGPTERLRIELRGAPALRGALNPNAGCIRLEAARTTAEAGAEPVEVGDRVWIACRNHAVLPTPVSSLHIIDISHGDADKLVAAPLVTDLAARMQITPVVSGIGATAAEDGPPDRGGLCVAAFRPGTGWSPAAELLRSGARQVLVLDPDGAVMQRMLIWTDRPSRASARALATASSLARHLTLDVTLLVGRGDTPARPADFRSLVDLRDTAMRDHGFDIRTEAFDGTLVHALSARSAELSATLLVATIAPDDRRTGPFETLAGALDSHRPGAVLFIAAPAAQTMFRPRRVRYVTDLGAVRAGIAP